MECHLDAVLCEPLGELLGVRVEPLTSNNLVADGNDFGTHRQTRLVKCSAGLRLVVGRTGIDVKSHSPSRRRRMLQHLLQDIGNRLDLVIVELHRFRQPRQLLHQLAWRRQQPPQPTNVRMMAMLTFTAVDERRTLESIATPCSVKTRGGVRRPP